jgi:hypothetical protein
MRSFSAAALDARESSNNRPIPGRQRRQPMAGGLATRRKVEPPVRSGKGLQLGEPRLEQTLGAATVHARVVMEPRSNLNQALEKRFVGKWRLEPDFLPELVRFEKPRRIECFHTLMEEMVPLMRVQSVALCPSC